MVNMKMVIICLMMVNNDYWLVVLTLPLRKIWVKVSWDDEIPNIWKNNPNVPNHRPAMILVVLGPESKSNKWTKRRFVSPLSESSIWRWRAEDSTMQLICHGTEIMSHCEVKVDMVQESFETAVQFGAKNCIKPFMVISYNSSLSDVFQVCSLHGTSWYHRFDASPSTARPGQCNQWVQRPDSPRSRWKADTQGPWRTWESPSDLMVI